MNASAPNPGKTRSTTEVQLRLFTGGACTHREKMVLRTGSNQTVAFPSLFAVIEHPRQGLMLFDTGYGEAFFEATQRFPERLYRLLTPVTLARHESAAARLRGLGYHTDDVRYVLISHFHGDHIGALPEFAQARFVFLAEGYQRVKSLGRLAATRTGFLPALLPKDFESRSLPLSRSQDPHLCEAPAPFQRAYDLFGDGSLLAIPLEGHFCGQMGLLVNSTRGPVLLAADACWYRQSFEELILPHPIAMGIMHDRAQYLQDLKDLQHFGLQNPQIPIIPSHCRQSISRYGSCETFEQVV